jgi:tetratricopeptide (TPR) repeat protein
MYNLLFNLNSANIQDLERRINDILIRNPDSKFLKKIVSEINNQTMSEQQKIESYYYVGHFLFSHFRLNLARDILNHCLHLIGNNNTHILQLMRIDILNLLGLLCFNHNLYQEAILYHRTALEISRKKGDLLRKSHSHMSLGLAYMSLWDLLSARDNFQKSLSFVKKIKKWELDLRCRNVVIKNYINLSSVYYRQRSYPKSIKLIEIALEKAKKYRNEKLRGKCLNSLSKIYYRLGELEKSRENNQHALDISDSENDLSLKYECYTDFGEMKVQSGNSVESLKYHQQALVVAKSMENNEAEGMSYLNIGNIYKSNGEYTKAIGYYEKALSISTTLNYKDLESRSYTSLGIVYRLYGNFAQSLEYHQSALNISKSLNDDEAESRCYGNLGIIYDSMNEYEISICYQKKALNIAKKLDDAYTEGGCYINLGILSHISYKYSEAIDYQKKALNIAKKLDDRYMIGCCYANLGIAYRLNEDYNEAIVASRESLQIAEAMRDLEGEAICYKNTGLVNYSVYLKYKSPMDRDNSWKHLRQCVERYEHIGSNLIMDKQKIQYYGFTLDVYEILVTLSLEMSKVHEAFEYVQRSKSKAFTELIGSNSLVLEDENSNHSPQIRVLLKKVRDLKDKRNIIQFQIKRDSFQNRSYDQNLIDIGIITEELDQVHDEIKGLYPEYILTNGPTYLSFDEVLRLL